MTNNSNNQPSSTGGKTRAKLKFLDGLSALAVMLLILEFWLYSDDRFGAIALWLLIVVIMGAQVAKMRLSCPNCGASVYRGWRYSYRSKVPASCSGCGKPLP